MGAAKGRAWRRRAREVCAETGPDDGVDPRELARERLRRHRRIGGVNAPKTAGRKALQLGRQVAEAVDAVLAGESGDEVLASLRVVAVTPAPDASRLLVTVAPGAGAGKVDPEEILARLARASGWLRTEVAAAVTRRKAPALAFRLAGPVS
jgi:ribosome-binding factor A